MNRWAFHSHLTGRKVCFCSFIFGGRAVLVHMILEEEEGQDKYDISFASALIRLPYRRQADDSISQSRSMVKLITLYGGESHE